MRASLAVVAAALIGLTACGGDSNVKLATSTSTSTAPAALMGTCGDAAEAFPADVITGPAPSEPEVFGDAPGAALRAFLDAGGDPGGGGFTWSGGDWLVLHRGDDVVVYGYRNAQGVAVAYGDRTPGGWNVSRYQTCHPMVVGASTWSVAGTADPAASYVTISYQPPTSCSGEVVPSHAETTVTETDTEVRILLRVTRSEPAPTQTGAEACLAMGSAPVEKRVELDSPLGTRALLDEGPIPAARR